MQVIPLNVVLITSLEGNEVIESACLFEDISKGDAEYTLVFPDWLLREVKATIAEIAADSLEYLPALVKLRDSLERVPDSFLVGWPF